MGLDFGLNSTKWAGMKDEMWIDAQSLLERNNCMQLLYMR